MARKQGIEAAEIRTSEHFGRTGESLIIYVNEPVAQFTDTDYSVFDQGPEVKRRSTETMSSLEVLAWCLNESLMRFCRTIYIEYQGYPFLVRRYK